MPRLFHRPGQREEGRQAAHVLGDLAKAVAVNDRGSRARQERAGRVYHHALSKAHLPNGQEAVQIGVGERIMHDERLAASDQVGLQAHHLVLQEGGLWAGDDDERRVAGDGGGDCQIERAHLIVQL